jgi:hypothetical protein
MGRIRSIHPDTTRSLTLADMGADAEIRARMERTFFRLLTQCDDDGRIVDDLRLLKGLIYPVHEEVTRESLDDELWGLTEAGLIDRYTTSANENVLQVVSWAEFQHPQRPTPSKLPAIDAGHGTRVRVRRGFLDDSETARVSLAEDSSPEGRGGEGIGVDKEGIGEPGCHRSADLRERGQAAAAANGHPYFKDFRDAIFDRAHPESEMA